MYDIYSNYGSVGDISYVTVAIDDEQQYEDFIVSKHDNDNDARWLFNRDHRKFVILNKTLAYSRGLILVHLKLRHVPDKASAQMIFLD